MNRNIQCDLKKTSLIISVHLEAYLYYCNNPYFLTRLLSRWWCSGRSVEAGEVFLAAIEGGGKCFASTAAISFQDVIILILVGKKDRVLNDSLYYRLGRGAGFYL